MEQTYSIPTEEITARGAKTSRAMGPATPTQLEEVLVIVEKAREIFAEKLRGVMQQGGLTKQQYVRYLSMQYHLTRGVQKHFFMAAGHPGMVSKRRLREFLFDFGLEEEPHYGMAYHDLQKLGAEPLPCPPDVTFWWAYFNSIINERPFVRLGATCILENLGGAAPEIARELLTKSTFIDSGNSTFLILHMHEILPHGDQIIGALDSVSLDEQNIADLVEGARIGAILYLRMADWALGNDKVADTFFPT